MGVWFNGKIELCIVLSRARTRHNLVEQISEQLAQVFDLSVHYAKRQNGRTAAANS